MSGISPLGSTSLANRRRIKRLVRRTIGLSKTTTRHDLVIGLFVNRYECGLALYHEINTWETPSFLAGMWYGDTTHAPFISFQC